MKPQFWSFIFRLTLFLIGIFFCKLAVFDGKGSSWEIERVLIFLAGVSLPIISIIISLPKIINHPDRIAGLEIFSRYLIQASLWCFLSLLIVELILRVVIRNPALHKDVTNWAGDIPAVHSLVLWGKEGYAITEYEKWGEIQTPYHDNKKNNDVIVLGDSQTESLQIADDLKFTSVAETIVHNDGYDIDLHNLGRSGLAMGDYISWIPAYRSLYRPKAIVIQLTESDFIESFHKDEFNYFVLQGDENIELVHTYDLSSGFSQVARAGYSFTPQINELGKERWYAMQGMAGNTPDQTANVVGRGMVQEVFSPELAAKQMQMLIEVNKDVPLIVILLPSAPYVSGDEIQMADPAHQQLKEFMGRYPEVAVIDPLPEFQKLVFAGHLPRGFFNSDPGIGHLNKYGSEIVGRLLAKTIEQVIK